jgi:hypothetical protein
MLLLRESYTALLKVPSQDIEFWDPTIPVAEIIAKDSARRGAVFMALTGPLPSEYVSPFILHLFYSSQTILVEKVRSTGSESALQAVQVLTRVLKAMDLRWKAACKWYLHVVMKIRTLLTAVAEYLEILHARELTCFG